MLIPAIAALTFNQYMGYKEHHGPPFVPYEHLRIRNKVRKTILKYMNKIKN